MGSSRLGSARMANVFTRKRFQKICIFISWWIKTLLLLLLLESNIRAIMTKVAIALHCTVSDHIFIFSFMYRRAHFLIMEITFFIWVFSYIFPPLCCLHDSKLKWFHTNWQIKSNFRKLSKKKFQSNYNK